MISTIILFLIVGVFVGLIAGLFGVGGGLIIVPTLLVIYHYQGYSPQWTTHVAVGTSLATIIITSISSVWAHQKKHAVRWDYVRQMALGLFVGAILGAFVAKQLSFEMLHLVIGVFALWVSYRMLVVPTSKSLSKPNGQPVNQSVNKKTTAIKNNLVSLVIGTASSIFGIGGGALTVPYLSGQGVVMQQAVATSSACGIFIALAGALGFMYFGQAVQHLPANTVGFVDVYAFFGISATSVIFAQYGAKLAHKLPAAKLKKAFAVFLGLVGLQFVLRALYEIFII